MTIQIYKTKAHKFAGTDFHEVRKKAFGLYIENEKDLPLSVVYEPRAESLFH